MRAAAHSLKLSSEGFWGLVILIGSVLVMAIIAVLPFLWYAEINTSLGEAQAELRFIESRLQSTGGQQRPGLTDHDAIDQVFVPGSTSGLGQANLQQLIGRLAEENSIVIDRSEPLDIEQRGSLSVLRLESEATGSIEGLRAYLLAIETAQPYLFVNQARISAPDSGSENPSGKLNIILQLEAYGWRETGS